MVKIIFIFVFFLLVSLFPSSVFASDQFAENYMVSYIVSESGETQVQERVTIRNLSNEFFGSNYTAVIPSNQIYDVSASDGFRNLRADVKKEGMKTTITVTFPEQVIGKDKQYSWTLNYKTVDFAQKQGNVWQFSVPKLAKINNLERYDVTLSIPTVFGDPSKAIPNPSRDSELGNSIEYYFTKDQLIDTGITMYFGKQQLYDFTLNNTLNNDGLLPTVSSIVIPSQGAFQEVIIKQIEPRPENVLIDSYHNTIAFFNIGPKQQLNVRVSGTAKLDLDRQVTELPEADQLQSFLLSTDIWDVDSPHVKEALKVAFEGKDPRSTEEKIKLIYDYVTSSIAFGNYAERQTFETNNSASSILNNPKERFCSDFVNVFIALSRGAQIPAQQVVGLAYSQNNTLRPVCFKDRQLHTWVRVYDLQKGWITVDPTWGATTGGSDFFSYSDLSHVQIGVVPSVEHTSKFPDRNEFKLSNEEYLPSYQITPKILVKKEVIAGFPFTVTFRVENGGNTTIPAGSVLIDGGKLQFQAKNQVFSQEEFYYPQIPPYGFVDFEFHAKSRLAWDSYADIVNLTIKEQKVAQEVIVKPIFAHTFFSVMVFGITGIMFALYVLALVLHYRSPVEVIEDVLLHPAPIMKRKMQKGRKLRKKKK
jgi:transglutaminase-like putative cysteine protease